jgi:ABC-type lipopolysaccharide export system ATPase subunit
MYNGDILAEGSPEYLIKNEKVLQYYLGKNFHL